MGVQFQECGGTLLSCEIMHSRFKVPKFCCSIEGQSFSDVLRGFSLQVLDCEGVDCPQWIIKSFLCLWSPGAVRDRWTQVGPAGTLHVHSVLLVVARSSTLDPTPDTISASRHWKKGPSSSSSWPPKSWYRKGWTAGTGSVQQRRVPS